MPSVKLAVLVSGSGRTLQNLIDLIKKDELDAKIVIVISSNPEAYAINRCRDAGLLCETVDRKAFTDDEDFSAQITRHIEKYNPDLILLAGFVHFYLFPRHYYGKILNIHPALLPKYGGKGFHGMKVHKKVLEAGEKESGCSVHFVDYEYDHGPIILQRKVPILADDTPEILAERVFKEECKAYPEAIKLVASGKVKFEGDKLVKNG